jgi:hypothetical protein
MQRIIYDRRKYRDAVQKTGAFVVEDAKVLGRLHSQGGSTRFDYRSGSFYWHDFYNFRRSLQILCSRIFTETSFVNTLPYETRTNA